MSWLLYHSELGGWSRYTDWPQEGTAVSVKKKNSERNRPAMTRNLSHNRVCNRALDVLYNIKISAKVINKYHSNVLWVKLFAYFSFSIVSNSQSQHFRIAKITKPKLPQRLCFGMKFFQNRLTEWIKLNTVRFLAELHFLAPSLQLITDLIRTVCLPASSSAGRFLNPSDGSAFSSFPLWPCALGANLIIKAPSFWPPATEKKKKKKRKPAAFWGACSSLNVISVLVFYSLDSCEIVRWTWCIVRILVFREINVWYTSLKMLTEHFAWQYFPITFRSVQPSAQSRRALLLKKKSSSFFFPLSLASVFWRTHESPSLKNTPECWIVTILFVCVFAEKRRDPPNGMSSQVFLSNSELNGRECLNPLGISDGWRLIVVQIFCATWQKITILCLNSLEFVIPKAFLLRKKINWKRSCL